LPLLVLVAGDGDSLDGHDTSQIQSFLEMLR
jgi:hypothetical protein